jgi:acetylcholinesterase
MVTGDMNDEGTLFSVTSVNVTTEEQARKYLRETYAPKATDAEVEQLATLYPQDPNVGSPYDTQFRNQLTRSFTFDFRFHPKRSKSNRDDFVLTSHESFTLAAQFKRLASFAGDLVFQGPRRVRSFIFNLVQVLISFSFNSIS